MQWNVDRQRPLPGSLMGSFPQSVCLGATLKQDENQVRRMRMTTAATTTITRKVFYSLVKQASNLQTSTQISFPTRTREHLFRTMFHASLAPLALSFQLLSLTVYFVCIARSRVRLVLYSGTHSVPSASCRSGRTCDRSAGSSFSSIF